MEFTNKQKTEFLNCDSQKKLQEFINTFEIESIDNSGNNILHYFLNNMASFALNWDVIIPIILAKGMNINAKQTKGAFRRSPLHMAVFLKQKEVASYLIKSRADVNSTDANGNSIISTAVMWYREQDGYFIELLLNHGADVFMENNHGVSAYNLAESMANSDVMKYFEKD